ncbi:MAG: Crp/Fnr family transcriptional regulator [Eubacteriaceae bacterium]
MDILKLKKMFSILNKVDDKQLELIIKNGMEVKLNKHQLIVEDNVKCSGVPFLISGRIRFYNISDEGKEKTLFRIKQGDICLLAALCLLSDTRYNLLGEAEEDSIVLKLPAKIFLNIYHSDIEMQKNIYIELSEKLLKAYDQIETITFSGIKDRIFLYLEKRADYQGVIHITHEKISKDLGTAREVISRNLKILQEDNKIKLSRGKITILK